MTDSLNSYTLPTTSIARPDIFTNSLYGGLSAMTTPEREDFAPPGGHSAVRMRPSIDELSSSRAKSPRLGESGKGSCPYMPD